MKAKNAAAALLALLACASCSQRNEGGSADGSLLPITSVKSESFGDYGSWRIYLNGLHGVYGEKGFYGIYPAKTQKHIGQSYEVSISENGEPVSKEWYRYCDPNKKPISSVEEGTVGVTWTNTVSLSFYLTNQGGETPSINVEDKGDNLFEITFKLNDSIVGEGSILAHQILTENDIYDYLKANIFFA